MAQLLAGMPADVPIAAINRQCSSGLQVCLSRNSAEAIEFSCTRFFLAAMPSETCLATDATVASSCHTAISFFAASIASEASLFIPPPLQLASSTTVLDPVFSLQAIATIAGQISMGSIDIGIGAGVESMSMRNMAEVNLKVTVGKSGQKRGSW